MPGLAKRAAQRRGSAAPRAMILLTLMAVFYSKSLPVMLAAVDQARGCAMQANLESITTAKMLWSMSPTNLGVGDDTVPTWADIAPYITVHGTPLTETTWTNLLVEPGRTTIHLNKLGQAPTVE